MKKYVIGIDEGSQSAKVLIFDMEGNVVCEGREPLRPYDLPRPGIVEHPDDDWWTAICAASKKAMEAFQGDVDEIAAIGLCTIRCCRAYLNQDGLLAQPGMSWMDIRVKSVYQADNPDVRYVTTSSGYITHRLTGEFKDTAANYTGIWPMDINTWTWFTDEEGFQDYNIEREMLLDLVMPGEALGRVTKEAAEATGLPEGLPVIATANDKAVEALGAGCSGEHTLLISLGTYISSMMQGKAVYEDSKDFWTNFACVPDRYLYESNGIRRGMWTVSWFKDILGESFEKMALEEGMGVEEALEKEAMNVPVGSDGLMTVLDWLSEVDAIYRKGTMIGFDGRHTRAHMYRSILEGIALTMKTHADAMCDELGIKLDNIIVSGGGSNSPLFMQIFADVFNLPASRNVINGSAGLGSAICAAVAAGQYKDFDEAVAKMVKVRDVFHPIEENAALYEKERQIYKKIQSHTDEILKESYQIFK